MAKRAAKGEQKPRKSRKPKNVPSADGKVTAKHNALPDDAKREAFLQHRGVWNRWQAKVKALEEIERELKANLKADGFLVKEFQVADQLSSGIKGETKVTEEVTLRLCVARWIGHPMGAQLDLFSQPDRTPAVDVARDAGRMASMEGKPADPPHSPETEQYREWMEGYHEHQATLAAGIKTLEEAGEEDVRPGFLRH
jgi:NurA-like 5'-3' nuclease